MNEMNEQSICSLSRHQDQGFQLNKQIILKQIKLFLCQNKITFGNLQLLTYAPINFVSFIHFIKIFGDGTCNHEVAVWSHVTNQLTFH